MATPSPFARVLTVALIVLCVAAVAIGGYKAAISGSKSVEGVEVVRPDAKKDNKEAIKSIIAAAKSDYMAIIELQGAITSTPESGSVFGAVDSAATATRKAIDAAAEDDKVKGVLLIINSPGGTVGMSQELNAAAKRLREKKPLVVSMQDMAASGGYYTAVAADKIVANAGTLTGSIGVIINGLNFKGLADKFGVKASTYKSGEFKDILSPYREAKPAEQKLIQEIVDESYGDFLSAVLEGRTRGIEDPEAKEDLSERIRSVADGRVVLGSQALQYGLVDKVGDLYDAKAVLQELIIERYNMPDSTDLPLKPFKTARTWLDVLPFGTDAQGLVKSLGINVQWPEVSSNQPPLPFSMRYANQPLWVMETYQ